MLEVHAFPTIGKQVLLVVTINLSSILLLFSVHVSTKNKSISSTITLLLQNRAVRINAVFSRNYILIGCFSNTSTKLILKSFFYCKARCLRPHMFP